MGSGKKQTIGYKYFLGLHLVLCRQMDALIAMKMASKDAWRGQLSSGRGTIDKPELFGGKKREGGFSGSFDVLDGNPDQPVNDYLSGALGTFASAYRGVVSLVWRRPYIGANSARLPSMEFKMLNAAGIHRGWLPDKALIGTQSIAGGSSIYIAMDMSGSMRFDDSDAIQRAALASFVRSLKGAVDVSVRVVGFWTAVAGVIQRLDCTDDDLEDIAVFIETLPNPTFGSEDYTVAFGSAAAFFEEDAGVQRSIRPGSAVVGFSSPFFDALFNVGNARPARRKIIISTGCNELPDPPEDPAPAKALLDAIPGVEVFCFNINNPDTSYQENFDNTPQDGVPNLTAANPNSLRTAIAGTSVYWADINPAHIIRCLWTDPMRGGTADESEIGDSFAAAAELFYQEGFGLSVPFRGVDLVESDRLEVERHVDAVSYRSRRTGKIEIKAIRNDYMPEDLPVLDSSIVLEWSGIEKTIRGELPNQLTVVYTKRENGEEASVTRTNVAGVRRAGRIIPGEPVNYPFITLPDLATRVCLRDLSVQDRPLLVGSVVLAYLPPELEIGEPFILNEPLLGINNVVARVMEIQEGDGRDNSVTVRISEDRYALNAIEATGGPQVPPPPVVPRPQASPIRVVQEAPYYLMVLDTSQSEVDSTLATEPDAGVLLATGTRATIGHIDITVAIDTGSGYADDGEAEFSLSVTTLSELSSNADATTVLISGDSALSDVEPNTLALINEELVRIDQISEVAGELQLTMGRGCLDTVPSKHAIGSVVVFLQNADPREKQHVASETIDVKLLTNLVEETLSLAAAPVDTVTFDSRAIRPYPPGRFKLNAAYTQDTIIEEATLTWVHRDRTLQTTLVPEDHDDDTIGPEVGTTYIVRVYCLDAYGDFLSLVTDINVGASTSYVWDMGTVLHPDTWFVEFKVYSLRDSYESRNAPSIRATPLSIITGTVLLEDSLEFNFLTEDGFNLAQET